MQWGFAHVLYGMCTLIDCNYEAFGVENTVPFHHYLSEELKSPTSFDRLWCNAVTSKECLDLPTPYPCQQYQSITCQMQIHPHHKQDSNGFLGFDDLRCWQVPRWHLGLLRASGILAHFRGWVRWEDELFQVTSNKLTSWIVTHRPVDPTWKRS